MFSQSKKSPDYKAHASGSDGSATVRAEGSAYAVSDAAGQSALLPSKVRRQSEGGDGPVIPDTCNLGVVLRTLIGVNGLALIGAVALSDGLIDAFSRFLIMAVLIEPITLASLMSLCWARRVVNGTAQHTQWTVALGLPALWACGAGWMVQPWMGVGSTEGAALWWVLSRGAVAAATSWFAITYFHLRARAFSPSFSEARLQALQARIRPHFLFNSLNTVLGLMRADPRRAEATLENLADLFRVFMRDARELVPLDDEVVTCKEYLAIEQLRLGGRLEVRWDLDDMPGDALLPSLLLQPLIENAVHHGIEPSAEAGCIEIVIGRLGERVRVEITNPVCESPPVRTGNQMALSNVRERLMLLYDMESELRSGIQDGRFRLLLEFPYRKERRRRDVRRYFDPDR
jgi:two-component system sensor histidine kinase AlgZ